MLEGKNIPDIPSYEYSEGDAKKYIQVAKCIAPKTGNKLEDKIYYRHSGFPGGIYETNFGKMHARFPGRPLEKAVKGMLPKGPLGYAMLKKLKIYAGATHPHTAQQPIQLEIGVK